MAKVLCPRHKDTNPSCEVYSDRGYCFVCATSIPLEELGVDKELAAALVALDEEEPEDIPTSMAYIRSLPLMKHRGLEFRADERGYFIEWPGSSYYKYRLFKPKDKEPKYIGPKGHKPPLFWVNDFKARSLILVEGEINALSVGLSFLDFDVCSPGSAGQFNAKYLEKHLPLFSKYSSLIVLLDKGKAGNEALMRTKGYLLYKVPFVKYIQLEPDANDILCERGKSGLREAIKLELQKGM